MRSLSVVTARTLGTLAAFWLALFALAGAVDLLLDSSVEMAAVRAPLMVAWLAASAAYLATQLLPERTRVPSLLALTVVLAGGTVVARELSGLVAPWLQVTLAGGMVLTAIGFLMSYRVVPWASVAVVALILAPQRWDEMVRGDSPVRLGVPLMEAVLIIGLGLLAALIRAVLTQSSRRADAALEQAHDGRRAAVAKRSHEDALSAQMTLLHDTALNTLDAIALRPGAADGSLRRRCREDARRLDVIAQEPPGTASSLSEALTALTSRARGFGLAVRVDGETHDEYPVPPPVVQALVGACEEALLNTTKHAGVDEARIRVTADDAGVRLVVTDTGVGFDPGAVEPGYGLEYSIRARMAAAGGTSSVAATPGGGTSVELTWERPQAAREPVEDAVSEAVQRLLLTFLVATTLFTSAIVVAEWDAFERPPVALAGGLVLGGWGLLVIWLLQRRRWIPTSVGVLTVALACVAPFWTISADQFCASSFAGLGWIDPRLPLVILVMLTAGRWWHASLALPAFVAATIIAGTIWGSVFSGCQTWAITGSTYAVAILGASLFAGRTLNLQAARMAQGSRQRDEAMEASLRAAALRVEQQQWLAPAVASCVPLLSAIGTGTADPESAAVRRRCQAESGYLRGLVTVAAAPEGVRDGLRELVQRARAAGVDVVVRGELRALPAPGGDLSPLLRDVVPADLTGATTMAITGIGTEEAGSVTVHLPGLAAGASAGRVGRVADAAVDVVEDGIDGWWMEISWAVGARGPAVSR
jgi:signal transduction histidine kinase